MMERTTRERLALSLLFCQSGLCFSTLASRIADIKGSFHLADSELGALLLIRPLGSLLGLPLAGWIVDRYGSRSSSALGVLGFGGSLVLLGLAPSVRLLALGFLCYGLSSNLTSISINAQALAVQKSYGRTIMSSFHGSWSLAGFVGASLGGLALAVGLPMSAHFLLIAALGVAVVILTFPRLARDPGTPSRRMVLARPDRHLVWLGAIAFCGMLCEGSVYDWGSVYFAQVVRVREGLVTAGIVAYMAAMATGRFLSDRLANRFGSFPVIRACGVLICAGMAVSVAFPSPAAAVAGFALIGAGTSSVIPLTLSQVGSSERLSPGIALAVVSTIGYFGFLLGPPVIGFVAEALSLRASFALVALVGLGITLAVPLGERRSVPR